MPEPSPFLVPAPAIRHIEERAATCLKLCCRRLGLREIPLPVPIDNWIEAPLGIRFSISDLSWIGPDVIGATFVRDREILISENVLSQEPRFRFTCAHELGHLTMHAKVKKAFHERATGTFNGRRPYERQADRFAAALLMPVPLLVREVFGVCDRYRLKRRECIVELMMDTPESQFLWKRWFLPAITRRFGVSLTAALYRFQDIRLRDGEPFLLPRHVGRLLCPAKADDPSASVRVVDGVPRRVEATA